MEELQNVGNQGSVLLKAVLLGVVVYGILLLILDSVFFVNASQRRIYGLGCCRCPLSGQFFFRN